MASEPPDSPGEPGTPLFPVHGAGMARGRLPKWTGSGDSTKLEHTLDGAARIR